MVVGNNWTTDGSENFWVVEYGGGGGLSEISGVLAGN